MPDLTAARYIPIVSDFDVDMIIGNQAALRRYLHILPGGLDVFIPMNAEANAIGGLIAPQHPNAVIKVDPWQLWKATTASRSSLLVMVSRDIPVVFQTV